MFAEPWELPPWAKDRDMIDASGNKVAISLIVVVVWNSCEVVLHSELIRIDELSRFAKSSTELSMFIGFIIVSVDE